MKRSILEIGNDVKERITTWEQAAEEYNKTYNQNISWDAFRKKYDRLLKKKQSPLTNKTTFKNDTLEIEDIIKLTPTEKLSKEAVLKKIVPDPENWEIVDYSISNWQMHTKEQTTKELYAVKVRLKPLVKSEVTKEEVIEATKELLQTEIIPLKIKEKTPSKVLDKNKMIEVPAIELHLGKMAHRYDTGENYDQKIAQERFNEIMEMVIYKQLIEKADTCFMAIGSDFFHTDTAQYTTTKGTPQQSDLRYKKMFLVGLKLYSQAIMTLRERFNKVDIQLCQGNHDTMASFYLYIALQQLFLNDKTVNFKENYQSTQCYLWGECAIFTNHGDPNLKRLQKSIPAEFYEEWGKSTFRELHLGHLHKEAMIDEESGMITRRVPSPCGTDEWHYNSRYVGNVPRYQIFVWHKEKGLLGTDYITFDKKKQLVKEY